MFSRKALAKSIGAFIVVAATAAACAYLLSMGKAVTPLGGPL